MSNTVTVNKNVTNVVTVTAQGPQGIQGIQGPIGNTPVFDSGSYTTTSSFNTFTSSYQTDSSSFNTRISSLTSATSSYVQNSQTSSFVTTSQTSSFVINSQTSSFATTGLNTFIGDQTITGSVNISGSLNANAQVYEVSFLERTSSAYTVGDNTIELDQDLIPNLNYTRNTNTITVNSDGIYKIYAQCNIEVSSGLSGDAELVMFINGNPYKTYYIKNIKSDVSMYTFSCVANLHTTDTIEFHINSNTQPFYLYKFSRLSTSVVCSYMTIEKLN